MSFDKATRNALARMVGQVRERLKSDVMDQLRRLGFQPDGTILDLDAIAGLSESEREAAREVRDQLAHFVSLESGTDGVRRQTAYDRLAREIGFMTLNRLVALRMAEERGLIVESVGKGLTSTGFQIYERVANDALGTRAETYRAYLESLYDELALDLPLLFDRTTPESRIFPGERCLEDVLAQLNDPTLAHLWKEDEAVGWVYQYYNDPAERKKMRDASQAPRNSRELAVRNQFFTPRYVVEFLTDNTLGRIWYEMRRGETRLSDDCQYLVRRKHPIWLPAGRVDLQPFAASQEWRVPQGSGEMWTRPNPQFETWDEIQQYALTVEGYIYAQEHGMGEAGELANRLLAEYHDTENWRGGFEELRVYLFFCQRSYRHTQSEPKGDGLKMVHALYKAICEAWDREADIIAYRPKKDPRDLKILDPACGSGHFLLYSFDLLTTIYEEAWEDSTIPRSEVTGTRLRDDYPDVAALRRAIPGLILRHNLHGVDIDPRACQIAGLALWLRAQRAYQRLGLKAAERPPITKSNVVCAEPMPGEAALLREFVSGLKPRVLGQLVEVIFDKMELAGEAGTLLKIEDEIRGAIAEAKAQWKKTSRAEQMALWPEEKGPQPSQLTLFDVGDISDETFWNRAEKLVLAALRDYASQATNGRATERRLFADDAERGFAFIDLCRQRFDVLLMNPPFGQPSPETYSRLVAMYPNAYSDLAAAFIARGEDLCVSTGLVGSITTRAYLQSSDLPEFRRKVILPHIERLVDLGAGVMDDAWVESSMQVLAKRVVSNLFIVVDRRQANDVQKEAPVDVYAANEGTSGRVFLTSRQAFESTPKYRIAYDGGNSLSGLINSDTRMKPDILVSTTGLRTFDDERFYRLRWEVFSASIGQGRIWCYIAKNTEFAAYYYPYHVLVRWDADGKELAAKNREVNGQVAQSRQGSKYYFLPGLIFSRRSEPTFTVKIHPAGCVFSSNVGVILPKGTISPYYLCGLFNSSPFRAAIRLLANKYSYTSGHVEVLAWQQPNADKQETISELASAAILAKIELESADEVDPHFIGIRNTSATQSLSDLAECEHETCNALVNVIVENSRRIDDAVREIYGIDVDSETLSGRYLASPNGLGRSSIDTESCGDRISRDLVSYGLGCSFGRWDIRIGRDPSLAPKFAEPFATLPVCTPGTLVGPDGLPATSGFIVSEEWLRARTDAVTLPTEGTVRQVTIADEDYPIRIAWDGILVDDPEHPADIVRRVCEVLGVLWSRENGTQAEVIEREVCEMLEVREVREYFRKPAGLFEDHRKRYSKSRRQAPIYWPLSTASGSYTLWIYYHQLTSDTLYTAVNRYVEPKIADVQQRLAEDERELEGASGREATQVRASIEQRQTFVRELQDFRQELLRVAALPYRPDLNDGVIVTAAPLHQLFRLPQWAKDTKACWEKLERGEYDWAHLAYTLWPGRVREKCRTDKSLAVAHGLEELYVEPPATSKKSRVRKAAQVEMELAGEDNGED